MGLLLKADLIQGVESHLSALFSGNAADGQRQLDVLQDRLVGDQVIGLKDETDRVIAVGVPIAVLVFLGRNAVDDQIAGVIAVQPSYDVEEGGLAGSAGSQDRHELVVPEVQGDVVKGDLFVSAGIVFFLYILKLKHCASIN